VFKLILHHPYTRVPAAIDVSGVDNHGQVRDVDFSADGAAPGSGALNFNLPTSRVSVRATSVFHHLHALKIETRVKVHDLGERRNLVEGDHSFAFFIHPDQTLWGTALGRVTPGGALDWHGTSSSTATGLVPLNQWVTLTYIHDGFSSIRLFIDGTLVGATYGLRSPIRPVGPRGVQIGNWPAGDAYAFDGQIDDVKISRWDPEAAYHQFFCRTVDACWKGTFTDLARSADTPDGLRRLRSLWQCIGDAQAATIAAVRSQGEEVIRQNDEFARRYRDLWCRGEIDGENMRALVTDWIRWLQTILGRERLAEYLRHVRSCVDRHLPDRRRSFGDCDPTFVKYINMLMEMDLA
jgi:hypothetical protein